MTTLADYLAANPNATVTATLDRKPIELDPELLGTAVGNAGDAAGSWWMGCLETPGGVVAVQADR